tara:strand:+ start:2412 stop:2516 length:105 start_codon:yes stop_codon:yes gene_type:complete
MNTVLQIAATTSEALRGKAKLSFATLSGALPIIK